ncbi:hypothetical protein C7974DRAFT_403100 [Boeremia exigua]|uniref:uncharacterized protein n=1 Tax=Boeremia exigua TaxID=749465 RepID=UPI001E8EB71D|nr:uncharacterized protein C7974DRAFT_403100 [Boeremia exigua]KAH6615022.1 hypothetical protein C7974DRAFT_403100 [Boeremia exigua]
MRLIYIEDDGAFTLVERMGGEIPPYAILSHTWGQDQDEVTYNDTTNGTGHRKIGYRKLQFCSQRTTARQLKYFWVDTCCIRNVALVTTPHESRGYCRQQERVWKFSVTASVRQHCSPSRAQSFLSWT